MIFAVDLGSTNMKAALYGSDGTRVAQASRPMPYEVHTNERTELSPAAVVECFHGLAKELVAPRTDHTIRIVSLTSQAQTFCVTDCDGRPVSPFYGWADIRAENEATELRSALGSSFHHQTGWPDVRPTHMISKVLWWARLNDWSDKFRIVSLPSFLAMQLGAAHVTDTNLAAMGGFFSIPAGAWWSKALDAVGVGETALGSLVAPGEPIQTEGKSELFSGDLKIVMAGNDHTAGAVGCSCHRGYSTLTLGTAGVIYRHAGEKPGPYSERGLWGPYPGGGYYELLCLDHACSALDWADEFLFGSVDSPRFVEHARRAGTGEKNCFFLPERWGSDRAWAGMETSKDIKAYAVLEGIGFSLRSLAGARGHEGQKEMLILGGGSRLDFWVQLISDIFRCPITLSSRDGLDGAAILAGLNFPDDHSQPPNQRFVPETLRMDELEKRYSLWRSHQLEPAKWNA